MSELSALRLIGEDLARVAERPKPGVPNVLENMSGRIPKMATTATGKTLDISRGFKVKGPDGTSIPFKYDPKLSAQETLDKAREWTKNFYASEDRFQFTDQGVKVKEGVKPEVDKLQIKFLDEHKKQALGWMNYDKDDAGYTIRMSKIVDDAKGKGYGAAMYRSLFEKAKKEGVKVRSDSGMSDESIAVWRRLKQLGYPIKEHPHGQVGGRRFAMRTDMPIDKDAPIFEYDPGTKAPESKMAPTKEPEVDSNAVEDALYSLKQYEGVDKDARERLNALALRYSEREDPALGERIIQRVKKITEGATKRGAGKKPGIYVDDETGETFRVDGSGNMTKVEKAASGS